jgi:hypothetical protein
LNKLKLSSVPSQVLSDFTNKVCLGIILVSLPTVTVLFGKIALFELTILTILSVPFVVILLMELMLMYLVGNQVI